MNHKINQKKSKIKKLKLNNKHKKSYNKKHISEIKNKKSIYQKSKNQKNQKIQ